MVLGLPAEMIMSGLLLWKLRCVSSGNRFLLMLGNASYAMYLLHPLLLGLLLPYPAVSFAMRVARFLRHYVRHQYPVPENISGRSVA
jgi:peptidoglycan/LPS O-acetylase OafA/YrhL